MPFRGLEASPVYIAGCICASIAGVFLATQSGINSTLGSLTGRSFAAVVSFVVGLAALIVFWLIDVYGVGNKGPNRQSISAAPWWSWTGGLLGAWYVAVVIIFARTLGAATLMAIFVTAQLSTAVALDALGWVGFRRRPLHWARIAGLLLMIAGVALVTYFDGSQGVRGAPATPSTANVLAVEEGSKPAGDNEPLIRSALSTDDVRGTVPVVVSEEHAAEDATRRLLEGPMLQSESNDASSRGLRCGEKGDVEMARSTLAAPSQPDG
ncbi:hypothetical protein Vafri_13103 [Volvox africanus]|uniref:Uncharacterized protein n=1 Tax=Volvox africanus TaxID=51714 RepID=A0A8J4F262_9CHLO|nr:hypothetical protein Vafri_13103 [Volvox africanus]